MSFSDFQADLDRAVESKHVVRTITTPRQTKADVVDYYKAEYGKGGTRKAAEALHALGIVKNKQGEPVKVESLMRRFQSRGGKSQAESSGVYAAMGMKLPAKVEHKRELPNQFTIKVSAKQGVRSRNWSVTFKGQAAKDFAANPTYQDFFAAMNYPDEVVDMFDQGGDDDDEYGLEVVGVV